jgi:hypothetical protein
MRTGLPDVLAKIANLPYFKERPDIFGISYLYK